MFVRLKTLRKTNNYTQNEIAIYLNITRPLYSLYENGKREIPLKYLSKLSKLYNTSIDYIVGDTDKVKPYKKTYLNPKP